MKTRILIVDDHAVLRSGLRLLINGQPDMEVIAEAGDAASALKAGVDHQPDIVLMDLAMNGHMHIDTIGEFRKCCPLGRVLVLTMHTESGYVQGAMAAGAFGYVVKNSADTELLTAIRTVAQGKTFVDWTVGKGVGQDLPGVSKKRLADKAPGMLGQLSPREREIFSLVAQGFTNQEIADQLGISIKSVETYRARVMDKLGLRSRADLVQFALTCNVLQGGKSNL
ncbi:response regulator transcription factor [uncultured Nitrospira sp.]|uniref:response regulator transcription factor n=1 Tax=uncultured Nitrospira sp. TaxID=157176 RepID=UPI0031401859